MVNRKRTTRSHGDSKEDFRDVFSGVLAAAKAARSKKRPRKIDFKYEPVLLSYLDVLGMRDLLKRARDDANKVAGILYTLRSLSKPDPKIRDTWKWKFTNFSDLVVRVAPLFSDAVKHRMGLVFHEIMDLCHTQVNLVNRGVLIRGAVTIGELCAQDGLVFGPALVKGYELESQKAVYPRIIVDKVVVDALRKIPYLRAHPFKEEMRYLNVLKQDADKIWYLDYMQYALDNADDYDEYVGFVRNHKSFIEQSEHDLTRLDPKDQHHQRRSAKVLWMKTLHQHHVKSVDAEKLKEETGVDRHELLFKGHGNT